MNRVVDTKKIAAFRQALAEEEKSPATISKYVRDVGCFAAFADGRAVDKMLVLEYKCFLEESFALTSANSMLAAVNAFFRFMGWSDCCVKRFRIQSQTFCPEEKELTKEEYFRLVNTARSKGDIRLMLIMQTICSMGIRISELEFVTVEAVMHGSATVNCKGKARKLFVVKPLQKLLLEYARSKGITSGPVFVTRSGNPLSRCNVWRKMKALCGEAGVLPCKVFPHNLRHLFAREFYAIEKDIAKLADILGHTSIDTTRIYIITTGEEHSRKMESLNLVI